MPMPTVICAQGGHETPECDGLQLCCRDRTDARILKPTAGQPPRPSGRSSPPKPHRKAGGRHRSRGDTSRRQTTVVALMEPPKANAGSVADRGQPASQHRGLPRNVRRIGD